ASQRWQLSGLRKESFLVYQACAVTSKKALDPLDAERLVISASKEGDGIPSEGIELRDRERCRKAYEVCVAALEHEYGRRAQDFDSENRSRCEQQRTSANRLAERKISELELRISRLKMEGKMRPV